MVGDLEQIDVGQSVGQQLGIDCLFDVPHQQESPVPDLSEEDDRHVVDARSTVRRVDWHLSPDRPEHPERDLVNVQAVARCEASTRGCL
jgi:hypothetical protein